MSEKKKKKIILFEMAYASSLGIALVLAVFGCLFLGLYIDRKLGTGSIFTLLFLAIGIAAGFRNYYVFIKRLAADAKEPGREVKDESHKENSAAKKN